MRQKALDIEPSQELVSTLRAYLNDVHVRLGERRGTRAGQKRLVLLPPTIRAIFEECETLDSWPALCQTFGTSHSRLSDWFRRSGIYSRCLSGWVQNPKEIARQLLRDAQRDAEHETRTYVALLDGVVFAEDKMDFGDFRIQRLREEELDRLFETSTNRLLYPEAVQDTKPFSDLWYLIVEGKKCRPASPKKGDSGDRNRKLSDRKSADVFTEAIREANRLEPRYGRFSERFPEVAGALKTLLLWPWWRDARGSRPDGQERTLRIPFVLTRESSRFLPPVNSPGVGVEYLWRPAPLELLLQPAMDIEKLDERWRVWLSANPDFKEALAWVRTTGFGSVCGVPADALNVFDEEQTRTFEAFVRGVVAARKSIAQKDEWSWFDRALNFLLKTWETTDQLEALLWAITALEAIFERKGEKLVESVSRRLDALIGHEFELSDGSTDRTNPQAGALFAKIYDIRSRLLHGDEIQRATLKHPPIAFRLAREALERMLYLLPSLAQRMEDGRFPQRLKRSKILEGLDQVNSGSSSDPVADAIRQILSHGTLVGDLL